ncbi:hypothetical protein Peur_014465 [Populus x canadensis]
MEKTAEPPQDPSDNAHHVVSYDSSPKTRPQGPPKLTGKQPSTFIRNPLFISQYNTRSFKNAYSPKSSAILPSASTELAARGINSNLQQANYIAVRNHILTRWRSYVSAWLTRGHALESIWAEHKAMVDSAYNFLRQHGYINFGMAQAIEEAQMNLNDGVERANVVVVGAGLAGLVAAIQSMAMGFKVFVLEGNARPGERVKTMKRKGEGVADVGASVLTGINGNPLGVLARKMGLHLHKEMRLKLLRMCIRMILVKWGGGGGDHCFIPGGNDTFVRELAKDLPIFYERTLESIGCAIDGVIVYANGQEFLGDMVLCTVLLGVLKKGSIEFVRGALLIALVSGDAAVKFETMSPVESVKRVLVILRGEESDSCFLCLHGLVSRKQAAVELSELQDDGNVGSKGLSSAGGESLVTYIKEA